MSEERRVTLREVARVAGVSVSAVSYALRGAANIPAETAARVRAVADKLGYRPNARVGELMAHIRQARPLAKAEPLALVYLEGDRATAKKNGFAQIVEASARLHAAHRGYRLDAFWLSEVEGNARRLAGILTARGISGVLFAPTVGEKRIELDWPWADFAVAVAGMSELSVALPRAGHHHYEAMREVLRRMSAKGARRPAAMIEATTNERAHRGWQAAWLAYGPAGAARRLWLYRAGEKNELAAWLQRLKPDALVTDNANLIHAAQAAGWAEPNERGAVLSWHARSAFGGIDQGYDDIAAHAVDLVVTQLQRNERGLPDPPPMLLFPGRWRECSQTSAGGHAPSLREAMRCAL
ncbi:LacI family DNA-binding transcriptional regulator [Rariglobus hedericola]|uniref:LacI family DNA-binding transcriptional regulator n=1 Tax=Rariglobus hedericola TaxID=2597822 RepID=UPI001EF04AC4|nr:LacI family DNA-binding transcriptional regulator [Rariglobus hedericola]